MGSALGEVVREWAVLPMPFLATLLLALTFGRGRWRNRLVGFTAAVFLLATFAGVGTTVGRWLSEAVTLQGTAHPPVQAVVVPTAGAFSVNGMGAWPSRGTLARLALGIEVARTHRVPVIVAGGDPAGIAGHEPLQ